MKKRGIKVVLVDDSNLVRAGLKRLIERTQGLRIVGEAGNADAAIQTIRESKPDVVVLDVSMPGKGGMDVLFEVKKGNRPPIVAMFTSHTSPLLREKFLAAGADHFFHKTTEFNALIAFLGKLAQGAGKKSTTENHRPARSSHKEEME